MKKAVLITAKVFGLTLAIIIVGFFAAVFWPLDIPPPAERPQALLMTNVNIVDVETGQILANQNILIENGKIIAVGLGLEADGAEILAARGGYAIPGLFDMHTHSLKMSPSLMHPLFIASGVTAVRDMGGCMEDDDAWIACADDKRAWNGALEKGQMVAPRYDHLTGLQVNGGITMPDGMDPDLGARTPEGARARAALDKARGLDFLKTYTLIPRESYFALAEAAEETGLYLAGHLPLAVSAVEAIEAGQRSLAHAVIFFSECFPGAEAFRSAKDIRAAYTDETRREMIEGHDAAACAILHERMREAGTAYVPTHTTRKLDAYAADEAYRSDPRIKYIPGPLRTLWRGDANNMAGLDGTEDQKTFRKIYEIGIAHTGIAHRAGVMVMAGTDSPDSFVFPGMGLHDELDHFIQAGLTPLDTLRTATLNPAKFLGLEGQAGVIKPGARADIVLLNANPLNDIRAVRDIDMVILAGAPYDRGALDGMLEAVEDNANSWTMWPKFAWHILRSPIMKKQFED